LPILLCNGQNIAEYETYWLMGFPTINHWGTRFTSVFSVFSVMARWIAEILFMLFFACVTNTTKLSTKQTGLSVFQYLIIEARASYSFLQGGIRKLSN